MLNAPPIFIVTGYAGSGKSTALAALEDTGFYTVDNMPVALLPQFLTLFSGKAAEAKGFAFGMDLREKGFAENHTSIFAALRQAGHTLHILFLEADEKTLLQRFSQTRRQHPLSRDKGVRDGIRTEKKLLADLRKAAQQVIDTTHCSVHDLKAVVTGIAEKSVSTDPVSIHVLSFGFKYGVPRDADLIMDVRFLANPYFIPELKDLTGKSAPVRRFVFDDPHCTPFLQKYMDLLTYLVPLYEKEGKAYLTIAVGCTGGRHRSVAVAEHLYRSLQRPGMRIRLSHRDIEQ